MNRLLVGITMSVLLVASGRVLAASGSDTCLGCACKQVMVTSPCGEAPAPVAGEANADGLFVCWRQEEAPPDSSDLCSAHCDALPTPPPSPCEGGMQVSTRYVTEVRVGMCESLGCPADEVGRCDDALNNDAWLDAERDCLDADCTGDPVCRAGAPVASRYGLVLVISAFLALGVLRQARATRTR